MSIPRMHARPEIRRVARWVIVLACALGSTPSSTAFADEPWLLSLEADAAIPLSTPQRSWFRPGGTASVMVARSLHPNVALGLRLRGGWLTDGPAPADVTLRDPGVGGLGTLDLVLRLRPFARADDPRRGTGLFVELGGGGAITGGLARGTAEVGVGWGFELGPIDLAPVARYVRVFQPSRNQLDDRDAQLLLVGLEVTLLDRRRSSDRAIEEESRTPERPDPSNDRDGDGLANDVDACPDEPEDIDGFEDTDGCPDLDNDADGIVDGDDACPNEAEDADGFEDTDGCPDPDNDRDGILDGDDACPNDAEVVNGIDDLDGCPDEGLIRLVDDRIVLEERVLFDFERARVKHAARPILDAIVELVRQHPEWALMRLDGHADVRGDADFNRRLSERRARNVMRALIERGLSAERLEFRGFGSERPRDQRRTEEAHQRNRRVEFVIVARRTETGEVRRTEVRDETDASLD